LRPDPSGPEEREPESPEPLAELPVELRTALRV
jgi:hypothetical protein